MRRTLRTMMPAAAATVVVGVFGAFPAFAQGMVDYGAGSSMGDVGGIASSPVGQIIATVVRALLGFVGFAMIIEIMHAWYLTQTHGGKTEAMERASAQLTNRVLGFLAVIVVASSTKFLVNAVIVAKNRYL